MKEWLNTKAVYKKWETGWALVLSNTIEDIFGVKGTRLTTSQPIAYTGTTDETIIGLEFIQSSLDPNIIVKKVELVDASGCWHKTTLIKGAPVAYDLKPSDTLTGYAINPLDELLPGTYNIFVKVKQKSKSEGGGE